LVSNFLTCCQDHAATELLAELDNGVEWVNVFLEVRWPLRCLSVCKSTPIQQLLMFFSLVVTPYSRLQLAEHGGLGAVPAAVAALVAGVQSEAHMVQSSEDLSLLLSARFLSRCFSTQILTIQAPFVSTLLAKLQLIKNETVTRVPLPLLVHAWGILHSASVGAS
jgi:hypothetical protein